jgi:hypothetical protein
VWPFVIYKRPATARAPPRTIPAGTRVFAAPLLDALAAELLADAVFEAMDELAEDPAAEAELMTELAFDAIDD